MDIFVPIVLVLIFFILFSVCGWCCKKHKEGTVYGLAGAPVTVTSQHVNASPVVNPPYPIDARHPIPQRGPMQAPAPGFVPSTVHQSAYPPASSGPGFYCPAGVGMHMGGVYPPAGAAPYPPAGGGYAGAYPPATTPYPPQTAPPSYSEAVAHPPPQPVTNEQYAKQSPYNPNF